MERSRKTELKRYFGEMSEPVAIVDKDLKCVYSNCPKLLPEDASIEGFFSCDKSELLYNPKAKPAVINGCCYSVKVIPIDEALYVCEFFDLSSIFELAENTDFHGRVFPMVDSIERSASTLWKGLSNLEEMLPGDSPDALKIALDMKKRVVELSSCSKNMIEYMNMFRFIPQAVSIIDLASFAKDIVNRCNTELSNSGRCVDFICEEPELYINAQQRHVMSALVNAIQNALMFSTRDCVPCLTLSRGNKSKSGEAIIVLMNNSSLYVEGESRNFVGQRMGYGIPIIKRFAELYGGTFELREENGIFTTLIELPLVPEAVLRNRVHQLSSGGYVHFDTGIPDILELKMLEITYRFGA
ncbi:MAG: ATP-binding protein [Oscillospiraceae bacterium]|nr:ATP-binding protein [Oscillospiraceae bacterium]